MKEFKDYLKVIFEHEGGLSDNINDPGGITQYGISLMFLKGLKLSIADIDHDGDIDGDDIRKLTKDKAGELYKTYFWDTMNLQLVSNEELKLHLFDMGVNAGNKTAILLLQEMLGISKDGILGKNTAKTINDYKGNIVLDYSKARKAFYLSLVKRKPKLRVFLIGWFHRVDTCKFI